MSIRTWKRRDWKNAIHTVFLAVIIMAAGFLGICALHYVLPKSAQNVKGFALQTSEDEISSWPNTETLIVQDDTPYLPFTAAGFPQDAQLFAEDMTAEALEMITDLLNHTAASQTDWDPHGDLVFLTEDFFGQAAIWTDEDGMDWLLWLAQSTENLQVRMAFHPEYGVCCVQIYRMAPTDIAFDRDEMLKKAVVVCQEQLGQWLDDENYGNRQSLGYADASTATNQFFGLSDGHTYRNVMILPESNDMPQTIIEEESGCRMVYPVTGGQVWITYDYQREALSGYAFVPDEKTWMIN